MLRQLVILGDSFGLLKEEDRDLRVKLEQTALCMLDPRNSSGIVTAGITIAGLLSDQKEDQLFLGLMQMLTLPQTNVEERKKIIKSLKKPLSQEALVLLARRLRDNSDDVCVTIFQ